MPRGRTVFKTPPGTRPFRLRRFPEQFFGCYSQPGSNVTFPKPVSSPETGFWECESARTLGVFGADSCRRNDVRCPDRTRSVNSAKALPDDACARGKMGRPATAGLEAAGVDDGRSTISPTAFKATHVDNGPLHQASDSKKGSGIRNLPRHNRGIGEVTHLDADAMVEHLGVVSLGRQRCNIPSSVLPFCGSACWRRTIRCVSYETEGPRRRRYS